MDTAVSQDIPPEFRENFPTLPSAHYNYANINLPRYFENGQLEDIDNTPNNNQVTDAGATLGRVLFYDVKLSANDTIACASCHVSGKRVFRSRINLASVLKEGLLAEIQCRWANSRYYENGASLLG